MNYAGTARTWPVTSTRPVYARLTRAAYQRDMVNAQRVRGGEPASISRTAA